MKRNIISAILLLATIAFSCSPKEEFVPSDKALTGDGSIVYNPTATIESFILDEPATKTVLAIDDVTGATFTFAEGDALGVFPTHLEIGNQMSFTVKSSSASSCTFNGGGFGLKEGQYYAAYYPYDSNNSPADPTEFELEQIISAIPVDYTNQRQTAVDGTFNISKTDYLVANNITPYEGACNFSMNHIGALVVMDVTLQGEGSATYTELTLSNDKYNFVKTGFVNLFASPSSIDADAQGQTVSLALGKDVNGLRLAAGRTYRFCMMVAPIDLKTDPATVTISLVDKANSQSHSAVVPAKNFRAGYAYKYACTVTAAAAEPDPVPTNLSANGTANCYIVDVDKINPEGYYFDCTVAGNGQTVDFASYGYTSHANVWPQINGTYTSALPAAHPTDIRVVLNQNNCISNVTVADGKISFKASGAKGNAQILMMDATNDDPAWVWHIWCTDQPGAVRFTGHTNDGGASNWGYGYDIMDRNLGALTNGVDETNIENMCGLYYQFGNPTGFTYAEFSSASTGSKGWRMVDGIAGAAKNRKPYLDVAGDWRWFNCYGSSDAQNIFGVLWGGGSASEGTSDPNYLKRGPAAIKTMYDPCPAGYKVMPIDFQFTGSDSGNVWGWYKNGTNGTIFIPYNGAAWEGTFWMQRAPVPDADSARYSTLWTSANLGNSMAYSFQIYSKDVNRAGGGEVNGGQPIARGMGVRCVADVQ